MLPLPAEDVLQRIRIRQTDGSWTDDAFHGLLPDALLSADYDLYTDGSCSTEPLAERRRAGWAVVWADAEGREAARLSGVVHRAFPQTPQAAEYLAALAAAEVAQPGHEVMCDCLGVVRHFGQRSNAKQLSAKLRLQWGGAPGAWRGRMGAGQLDDQGPSARRARGEPVR